MLEIKGLRELIIRCISQNISLTVHLRTLIYPQVWSYQKSA